MVVIIIFIITVLIGLPVAFVLGLLGSSTVIAMGDPSLLSVIPTKMFSQLNLISLTCIPFFILAGELMNGGGVTKRLLDLMRQLIGWIKGGLSYACVVIAAILSAILGNPNSVCSMLCGIVVPEMRKDGYPEEFTGALVASSSILGPIIPPSLQFVMFCMMTEVSIKYMFIAGVVPGILLAVMFCIVIAGKVKTLGLRKSIEHFNVKKFFRSFLEAIPALCVPAVIIVGVMGGFFTTTESGAVSCVVALIAGLIYRELDLKKLPAMFMRASIVIGSIMLLVAFGGIIAYGLALAGIPELISGAILSVTNNPNLVIFFVCVLIAIAGCVMDSSAITLVFLPCFYPLMVQLGFDGVHFGIVFCVMTIIGFITPPVGTTLFVTSNVTGIPFSKICKQIAPFVAGAMVITFAMAYLPNVVLWLPRLLGYTG